MRAIGVIAAKDLVQRIRDRSAIIMAVVAPLALALVLNGTLGSAVEQTRFQFGLADLDGGEVSTAFVDLLGEIEADGVADLTTVGTEQELRDLVDAADVNAGYLIRPGFSETVLEGRPVVITVLGDPGAPITVSVAEAIAQGFASELDYVNVAIGTLAALGDPGVSDPVALTGTALAQPRPITITDAQIEGRGFDPATYYAISLSIFFLFLAVQFGILSLIEEREGGTLSRLVVAPIDPARVLVGKLVSSFVFGVVTMAVMIVATTLLMDAQWGNPLLTGLFVVIGVVCAISIAALVASVARTAEQAGSYTAMAAIILGLLGGAFFPIIQGPLAIRILSHLTPHRWLLNGLRDVSYGASFSEVLVPLGALVAFIVVAGGIGLTSARRALVR